ncbi:MAG TPA: hypothetical protein VII75_11310 [Thermoanaerobaculia bacterium]|nr:hypothetical protein [Thermoanaerobaculia bacterium]
MPVVAAGVVRRREPVLALSSVALAMLPKCPLCFLALAGAAGAAAVWVAPLTIAFLALTIATVAKQARLVAVAAAMAILAGRYADNKPLVLAGCAALIAASLWRTRNRCRQGECR